MQYSSFVLITAETITKCNRAVLEQINKVALSAALKEVQRHKQLFNNCFCSATQEQEEVQVLKKAINTEKEIFVTPKINFDILIFDDYLIEELHVFIRKIESLK
ncbi:hypothetical protein [Candidatus Cardinium hertigii]|uniref:Uncharacterized protein n=1 Tax=Candidatus Cardinium hertigii TaxID=247481 RepID=A0A2Z3L7G8_9BACT|nr:hypothetical protein [Candidatus Cardinium hertigii]AWN81401.1 hypothetical protein DK880_00063 [Candidatus Cardinium hertigii]